MRMGRRDFLKGLLAISAVAAFPVVGIDGSEPFVVDGGTVAGSVPTTGTMLRSMGRLGRVRIGKYWFPLEDASFTMFRRHAKPVFAPAFDRPGQYNLIYQPNQLVTSPWQVQIFTPDMEIQNLFERSEELEFEFSTRYRSFVGNGFVMEMGWEKLEPDEGTGLFSLTLEGSEKLRRIGESRVSPEEEF